MLWSNSSAALFLFLFADCYPALDQIPEEEPETDDVNRRDFAIGAAALLGHSLLPRASRADVPTAYNWQAFPPLDNKDQYIAWMVANRGEDPVYLAQRWDRYEHMIGHRDLFTDRDKRAFLMTPREEFCLKQNLPRAYERDFLDIGFGVTISGPNLVGRMTSSIDVQYGEKVLEVGTGSGYQSAYLANLTDKVWSIEIIKPLAERTRSTYDALIKRGYSEYAAITTKNADGYYGWEEAGPFDKIIVTCGIDHIPPPLLRQLKSGGIMVIPIGPPGAQHVLKVVKKKGVLGGERIVRSDIYRGSVVPFVPFTKLEGDEIVGTHNQ
ncbi:MAG: protein-L-isoaspartate O-methyltransferase [Bauldia sp.]|nr:protein-L-isoaspartate O-methyltransferase [Bauldia sp.]